MSSTLKSEVLWLIGKTRVAVATTIGVAEGAAVGFSLLVEVVVAGVVC